jgi:hypothetical protein
MDFSQLPDMSSLLVTKDNPARADLSSMDHARCATLHNYILHYAWIAEGRSPATLQSNNNNFFTAHGTAAENLRPRLDSSVAAFLDTALLPPADTPDPAPFFFWASGISDSDELFDNYTADLYDEPEDSLLCLYLPNIGNGGGAGAGVFYHQGYHRAAVFMHLDEYTFAMPIKAHLDLWYPFETVLSNWIELIHLGKITASPTERPSLFGSEKIGPWEWRPYSETQVANCISAWDRLCDAIEGRVLLLSPASTTINEVELEPLLTPASLDAASVPKNCFVREFLTRARRPKFQFIAPGLLLPPAGASEFAAMQPFTSLTRTTEIIPPVCLFTTRRGEPEAELTLFSNAFLERSDDSAVLLRGPAGIYSESVDRYTYDTEDAFRLLLPYGLEGDECDLVAGARKSDGSSVGGGTTDELFQHGYKPFGGEYYRPQRLERLFDHWRKLVDDGVWSVGTDGVKGTIDTFKNADTMHWREYRIPPTW